MSPTLLVAMREYRQYAGTRAFRISLVMMPLIFLLIGALQAVLRPPDGFAFVMLDRTGPNGLAIERQLDLQYQQQVMGGLAGYARRWNVALAPLTAERAGRPFSREEAAAFRDAGGLDAALAAIRPHLPAGAPAFAPPNRRFQPVPLPAGLGADATEEAFANAVRPWFGNKVDTPLGRRPLVLAIYVPQQAGAAAAPIRFWTGGANAGAAGELVGIVRAEATRGLRLRALRAAGIDAGEAARLDAIETPIDVTTPPGSDRGRLIIRSALSVATAYLLLLATLITSNMMLQGMIEERSNKLLEMVLSAIDPRQLMGGKLVGIGAVGLTLVAAWMLFAVLALRFLPAGSTDIFRPALASLGAPLTAAAIVFYFFSGYVAVAMLFLAIGSMSDSMQDAQGYLMPIMTLITVPIFILMTATFQNPDGILPVVLSWIPPYAPFAMLMRLGAGLRAAEILGTSLVMLAFVIMEFLLLGRVFRANLLRTGQPPRLGALLRIMFAREL